MLSLQEKEAIERELAHAETPEAACIEALKIIQRHRGHVSDDGLLDLSDLLGMSVAELDSVATFYNLIFRRPVGRHVILLCDSVSCWILGYERLLDHLQKRLDIELGETTEDGAFTLLTIPCLGACDKAPAMMIDELLYGDLTAEKIDAVLEATLSADCAAVARGESAEHGAGSGAGSGDGDGVGN